MNSPPRPRELVVLGSTGSIGTQAVDVITGNPDRFRVVALAAGGSDPALLAAQAVRLGVEVVAVARDSAREAVESAIAELRATERRAGGQAGHPPPVVIAGPQSAAEVAAMPCDTVLNGLAGADGLSATLAALAAGRTLALANKESLVAGGPLVRALARPGQIVPVDSEHSALAQCLRGGAAGEVGRLVLTASGGPFRGWSTADLSGVTVEQALDHPTWSMGPLVTINSATLVNKGLEVIEAHELFGIAYDRIDVVVHPQSIVHSMVEFTDGSTLAQASPPNMRLPIALALGWPDRVPAAAPPLAWTTAQSWEFFPLDDQAFPAVRLAKQVGSAGGVLPAVFNAANEECVEAFVRGRLRFTGIVETISRVVEMADGQGFGEPSTVTDVLDAQVWARARARELAEKLAMAAGERD